MANDSNIFSGFDEAAFTRAGRIGRWFAEHWFRFEIRGLQNLPDGPCLVVGNHSGFGFIEELLFVSVWSDRFGARRVWGLIHDMFFTMPIVGRYYEAIGAIPASPKNAHAAFERGDVVLVFPGGDMDCCRPFYLPRTVRFGDRRGYVRLALDAGVPIVPLATIGSHWTWTFLPGGRLLARIPWVRRTLRTDCVPLPTAAFAVVIAAMIAFAGIDPWWTVAVVAALGVIPTPVRVTSELGEPIQLSGTFEEGHEMVFGALQAAVRELEASPTRALFRPIP